MSETWVCGCHHIPYVDCPNYVKLSSPEQPRTESPSANFVSDFQMPSCHVCGEIMTVVCPKCGSSSAPVPSDLLGAEQLAELAEQITYKIQSLLSDKYENSFKIACGIIGQELHNNLAYARAALSRGAQPTQPDHRAKSTEFLENYEVFEWEVKRIGSGDPCGSNRLYC